MKKILSYLKDTYIPLAVILYGSYADGSNNLNSDFDALLITADGARHHDVTVMEGIPLDVFVYPISEVMHVQDYEEFVQIIDGKIIFDTNNIGRDLMDGVQAYWNERPGKSLDECTAGLVWCKKMITRTQRGDAEAYFRWHWVLVDSLEIACDTLGYSYRGPKKSLRWLKENHLDLYESYCAALKDMRLELLEAWIMNLEQQVK